jgi:hypothetical protein
MDFFIDFQAVLFRHDNIGNHQRDVRAEFLEARKRIFAIDSGDNPVSGSLQYTLQEFDDDLFIFGDEYGFLSLQ